MAVSISAASMEELQSGDLVQRLREFNYAHVGEYHYGELGTGLPIQRINLNAYAEHGQVVGGIQAYVFLSMLRIEVLFVDESVRGQGIGARLLLEAERLARGKGAKNPSLETFEFQAPHFYAKHGYVEVSRLAAYAKKYYLMTMAKSLQNAPA